MLLTLLFTGDVLGALYYALAILPAIMFHELSHAYAAYLCGDTTAKQYGRISFNPLKHLDLIGTIMILLVGFGWAKPVPINPRMFKNFKLGTVIVSLAGPVSNFLLAFAALLILTPIYRQEFALIIPFFIYLIIINIGLGVFNLIPIPPLDGSKILFALLPRSAYEFVLTYERYGFIILIALLYFMGGVLSVGRENVYNLLHYLASMILPNVPRIM